MALNSLAAVQTNPIIKTAKQIIQYLNYRATHTDAVIEYRISGTILHIYLDASYIFQNQRHEAELVDIFPRTTIQDTNTINAPQKWPSTCIMQHNEECDGINHGKRVGRIIWKLLESEIHENGPIRKVPPTTTNNHHHRWQQTIQRKKLLSMEHKNKKYLEPLAWDFIGSETE